MNAAIDPLTARLASELMDSRHTEPRGDAMFVCSKCQRISTTTGTPADGYLQGHHVGTCDNCSPDTDAEQTLEIPAITLLEPATDVRRHAASA